MIALNKYLYKSTLKARVRSFPDGPVLKNLPANAGDMGLISGPGRSPGPGDLPQPGIKTGSLALQEDYLPSEPSRKPVS